MSISASMVKELRERTGAGMMECKKALVDTGGDMDAAVELLRKSGQAKADNQLAGGDGRQIAPFLLFRTVKHDAFAAHPVGRAHI